MPDQDEPPFLKMFLRICINKQLWAEEKQIRHIFWKIVKTHRIVIRNLLANYVHTIPCMKRIGLIFEDQTAYRSILYVYWLGITFPISPNYHTQWNHYSISPEQHHSIRHEGTNSDIYNEEKIDKCYVQIFRLIHWIEGQMQLIQPLESVLPFSEIMLKPYPHKYETISP